MFKVKKKITDCLIIAGLIALTIKSNAQNLVVKPNSPLIETKDGQPFLWIGDTAWELFRALNKDEVVFYLDNRKSKGFTVIQAVIFPLIGGVSAQNAYGERPLIDKDPAKPNEKYFEHVDFVVREAEKRGIVMTLLPTWADNVVERKDASAFFNTNNARAYGRFLGNRYKKNNVVWMLGGDRNVQTDKEFAIWNSMAAGVREGSQSNNLITYHPTAPISSHYWFHNEPWLSFNSLQTGHFKKFNTVYEFGGVFQQLHPTKPFINAEPSYEDIGVLFWHYFDFEKFGKKKEDVIGTDGLIKDTSFYPKGFFDDYDVRMEAYWTFFSGGVGYTYGNNAVWQMYKPGDNYSVPCLTFWDTALDRPGADDMRHVSKLFTRFPLGSFHIDQSVIYGTNFTDENNIRGIVGNDNSFILIYLNKGQDVRLNMSKLKSAGSASWFNPREGTIEKIGPVENKGIRSFDAPGVAGKHGNDWILIIERA